MTQNFYSKKPSRESSQGTGITLDFVLHVLFRHKWKILLFSLVGIIVAGAIRISEPPVYRSSAKLLVRYVMDHQGMSPAASEMQQIRSPDSRGENIINSEIEILTSIDLAAEVVDQIGPEKILSGRSGETNRTAAVGMLVRNLSVAVPRNNNVITVSFDHSDPAIPKEVLGVLTEKYLEKHVQVHRSPASFDFLRKRADQLRSEIGRAEDDLRQLKKEGGVLDVREAKTRLSSEMGGVRKSLLEAEAQLAAYQARVEKAKGARSDSKSDAGSVEVVSGSGEERLSRDRLERLYAISKHLRETEMELLETYKPGSKRMTQIREQIRDVEGNISAIEKRHPEWISAGPAKELVLSKGTAVPDEADVAALKARTNALGAQLKRLQEEAQKLDAVENDIIRLEREKALDETNYRFFATSLEQAKIDDVLDAAGNVPNISIVQHPSTVGLNPSKDANKVLAGILAAGIGTGVGLAFLLDLVIFPRLSRPQDIRRKLGIPLYLSIPNYEMGAYRNGSQGTKDVKRGKQKSLLPNPRMTSWSLGHPIRNYVEALRDRVVKDFEGQSHRPKLIGVTSPIPESGVTTMSLALAASLSETGEGKVLLVDLKETNGQIHPFFKGTPANEIPDLVSDFDQAAAVQDNLFAVRAASSNGGRHPVRTKQFADELMPKLKASDYDYIVFDMPPITQTSVAFRLSSYLDRILLVIRAEATPTAAGERAVRLLGETGNHFAGVLNRTKAFRPTFLGGDDEG